MGGVTTGRSDEVTPESFRSIAGHFAAGVTVVSTTEAGTLYGTTVSAVSSLSLEPPMMLVCLNTASATHNALVRAGVFGISILASSQGAMAYHFGRRGGDKFATVAHHFGAAGVPLLDGALATIVCEVESTVRGGTHTVFLGRVREAEAQQREPLAYYRGKVGRLADSAERTAYEEVRAAVLMRRTPLGEPIDIDALARTVGEDAGQVLNALIRLNVDGHVQRDDDGTFRPTPMTAQAVADIYEARLSMELGVLETRMTDIDDETRKRLVETGEAIARVRSGDVDGLEEYLQLNLDFHSILVGISGSEQLVESFRKLGSGTSWRQALTPDEWAAELDDAHIREITHAVLAGELGEAKAALRAHVTYATALAKRVIERAGGSV